MSLTMSSNYRKLKLEKSVKSKMMDFLMKLDDDDSVPGLHVEPINNSADKRFRTGRVDDFYRAALFRIDSQQGTIWVVYGVYPHDDVIDIARKVKLTVNPVNGVTEVEYVESAAGPGAGASGGPGAAGAWQDSDWAKQQEAYDQAAKLVGLDSSGSDSGATKPATPADPVFGDKPLAETLGRVDDTQLTGVLGISPRAVGIARGCTSVDELLTAFERIPEIPEWQVDALLDLASGTTLAELQDKLKGAEPEHVGTPVVAEANVAGQPGTETRPEPARGEETGGAAVASAVGGSVSEDDALAAGLRTPAAQLSFAAIKGEEELKAVVEDGDFAAWRVFLHPEQRRYAQSGYNGPFRLTGGAGTGKTIVLVHRAVRLAKQKAAGATDADQAAGTRPRVVLTTYTANLADQLDEQVAILDPHVGRADRLGDEGLHVAGLDKLVYQVLHGAQNGVLAAASAALLGRSRTTVLKRTNDRVWQDVLDAATAELPERARSAQFLQEEYEQVVLPARIVDAAGYKKVRRVNRSVRMSRQQRTAVWQVFEAYRTREQVDGTVSWEESRHLAALVLEQHAANIDLPGRSEDERRLAYRADHVLVDEGQDLNPGHWTFLRSLVRGGRDDMFIAEDAHQRIYGAKVVLSHFGINIVGRSRTLSLNYRTTEAILRLGLRILSGGAYTDVEEKTTSKSGYRSLRAGVEPSIVGFANRDEEFAAVAKVLDRWLAQSEGNDSLRPEENAILVRNNKDVNEVTRRLAELGIPVAQVSKDGVPRGKPVVMTMHRSKGTEFRNVVIMHVGKDSMPPTWAVEGAPEEMRADKLLQERSLLYVAATRARDELMVTYTGEKSGLLG
ncbi:3'-5' exonuclease [Brevibacterium moorei]|uniref:3'-5' exonuclease n=1 Tax=Brevibacterium moorei TaxID=2968457 RepID=UPI00211C2C14|nr:3'-5' exonuclease [Brevibacterium sp. 68QC2CO]MCQ9385739.1 UvrD-helicase domain-containing protein [Brevibacterium sp. 68QC2CO]